MTKAKKIWIGILSVLPLLSFFIFIIYMLTTFTTFPFAELEDSEVPLAWIISRIIDFVITGVIPAFLHLGLMIYFIVHAMSNPQVKKRTDYMNTGIYFYQFNWFPHLPGYPYLAQSQTRK